MENTVDIEAVKLVIDTEMTGNDNYDDVDEDPKSPNTGRFYLYKSVHHRGEKSPGQDSSQEVDEEPTEESEEEESEEEEEIILSNDQKELLKDAVYTDQTINKKMMVEFIKYGGDFLKVLPFMEEHNQHVIELFGLYFHCIKGDCQNEAKDGGFFSNKELIAKEKEWMKNKGKRQDFAMHEFIFEAQKIFENYEPEAIPELMVNPKITVKAKEMKRLSRYLDLYLVVNRHQRHFSASFLTESLDKISLEDREESDDEDFEIDHARFRGPQHQYYKPKPAQNMFRYDEIQLRGQIRFDMLKKKMESIIPKKDEADKKKKRDHIETPKAENYSITQLKLIVKLQTRIKKLLAARAFKRNVDPDQLLEVNQQQKKKTQPKIKKKEKPDKEGDESHDSDLESEKIDPQEVERIRRLNYDFWAGKILSKFPHMFYDLDHKNAKMTTFKDAKCRNCDNKIISKDQKRSEKLWHSRRLGGFFCKNCIHPVDSDMVEFLFQLKQSHLTLPKFKSDDRRKKDAIMVEKDRDRNIKAFCYKNQNLKVRRQIFPEKWQWRMNEQRNVLQQHEFLPTKAKKTLIMNDLASKYGNKSFNKITGGAEIFKKGYTVKKDEKKKALVTYRRKLAEQSRKMTATNTLHFRNINNVAIPTYKSIYNDTSDLKIDRLGNIKMLIKKETPAEPKMIGNKIQDPQIQKIALKREDLYQHIIEDKQLREWIVPFRPLTFIINENRLGFISKNSDLLDSIIIEPYTKAKETFLIPSSEVFETFLENESNKGEKTSLYKQYYSLCFFIAAKSNDNLKEERDKNRGILQIYEIEANWSSPWSNGPKVSQLNVVNHKLLLNINVLGDQSIVQNITQDGSINGIKIFDAVSNRLLQLERTMPYSFAFQNEISFGRYQKFYKNKKPYKNDKIQILMLEAQLTDKSVHQLYSYQQIMILNNAVKILINHVPFNQKEYDKYEFLDEHESMKLFMEEHNWVQPLGALGGRSMLSFLLVNENIEEELDNLNLQSKVKPSLFDIFIEDQPKLMKTNLMHVPFEVFMQSPVEISTDLAYRNPIHDCLDQPELKLVRKTIKILIDFVASSKNSSMTSRKVLMGLMHRVLQDDHYNLSRDYTAFLIDDPEGEKNFSKFTVHIRDTQFEARQDFQFKANYFNEMTHLDPEESIKQTYTTRMNRKEIERQKKKEEFKRQLRRKFTFKQKPQELEDSNEEEFHEDDSEKDDEENQADSKKKPETEQKIGGFLERKLTSKFTDILKNATDQMKPLEKDPQNNVTPEQVTSNPSNKQDLEKSPPSNQVPAKVEKNPSSDQPSGKAVPAQVTKNPSSAAEKTPSDKAVPAQISKNPSSATEKAPSGGAAVPAQITQNPSSNKVPEKSQTDKSAPAQAAKNPSSKKVASPQDTPVIKEPKVKLQGNPQNNETQLSVSKDKSQDKLIVQNRVGLNVPKGQLGDSTKQPKNKFTTPVKSKMQTIESSQNSKVWDPQQNKGALQLEGGKEEKDENLNKVQKELAALEKEQQEDEEKEFEVDHYYIDFRHIYLQANLQNILGKPKYQLKQEKQPDFLLNETNIILGDFYATQGFDNNLQSTKIISLIYEFYKHDIDNMRCMSIVSECQFVDTKMVISRLCACYVFMCVIPFLLQLYFNSFLVVLVCMVLMFLIQSFLLILEYLQMRSLTWNIYKQETWNFVELSQVLVFYIYMVVRIMYGDRHVLPHKVEEEDAIIVSFWVVFNTILLLLQVLKLLYFMRVSEKLAKIVKLSSQVFYDVSAFTVFLIFWVLVFLFLFIIAGFTFDTGDYDYTLREVSMLLQIYRNSFGDISTPQYDMWTENEHLSHVGKCLYVLWAWVLFSIHEFFILIVLLNFLIAIVSQSYDSIMDNEQMETTMSKIYLNNEAAIIFDAIDLIFRIKKDVCQIIHLVVDMSYYEDSGHDFQGFVRTMKIAMKKECQITTKAVREKITELDKKIDTLQVDNTSTHQSMNVMTQLLMKIDSKFNKFAKKMTKEDIFEDEEKHFFDLSSTSQLGNGKLLHKSKSLK